MEKSALNYEVVLPHRCLLGEGPVWDARRKSISWIDILNRQIHEYAVITGKHHTITLEQMVGAIALCQDENWILAALQDGIYQLNRSGTEIKLLCDPEAQSPGNRFNDGKCDPAGRFWVGSLSLTEQPGAGNLYRVEIDGSYRSQVQGTTISNGMAWSPEGRTFYYIDTPTRQVMAYDYHADSGVISNPRVALMIPEAEGYPDGMTIDEHGMLWIAHWDGWQVARWDPHTGKKLLSIRLPVARITSCTFGGDDLNDLYITSASKELPEKEKANQPLAGSLFVVKDCGFKGMETIPFAGL